MWEKKNHGGEKMPANGDNRQYAIFIGRWQPYHYGHIHMVRQKLDLGIPVIIMVRNMDPDERNPFTTKQTMDMIKKYHREHDEQVVVMSIPDIESVNFGRGVGYEVNEFVPPKDLGAVSATKIRDSIKNGDDAWRDMIDPCIQDDVVNFLLHGDAEN